MSAIRRSAAAAGVSLAVTVLLSGCFACTTIGYVNSDPAIIELDDELSGDASIAACFGELCDAAPLPREDGLRWTVPQEPPYVADELVVLGGERTLRVVVANANGETVIDAPYEIPVKVQRSGWFGQCSGPVSFLPVKVSLVD